MLFLDSITYGIRVLAAGVKEEGGRYLIGSVEGLVLLLILMMD